MPTDTAEQREEKIKKINDNYYALEEVKTEKFEDINNLLTVFEGQLSLTDVLNQDIPFLNKLREVRQKANDKANKERIKQQQKQQQAIASSTQQKK